MTSRHRLDVPAAEAVDRPTMRLGGVCEDTPIPPGRRDVLAGGGRRDVPREAGTSRDVEGRRDVEASAPPRGSCPALALGPTRRCSRRKLATSPRPRHGRALAGPDRFDRYLPVLCPAVAGATLSRNRRIARLHIITLLQKAHMPAQRKLTPELISAIVADRRRCQSYDQIAKRHGVGHGTIRRAIQMGSTVGASTSPKRQPAKPISP